MIQLEALLGYDEAIARGECVLMVAKTERTATLSAQCVGDITLLLQRGCIGEGVGDDYFLSVVCHFSMCCFLLSAR
jgi:hypothetical protein